MNNYYSIIYEVKDKIKDYIDKIYQVSGDELLLELEHYNLLTNKNNCIEKSTATGYIMEEFITSKLQIYTMKFEKKKTKNEVIIKKLQDDASTNKLRYDCYAEYKGILFLINVKVEKNTAKNNAVAGINILYNDYVMHNKNRTKAYLVLKTYYSFTNSKKDKQRKINGTKCYALEEVDFSKGHMQDHRNWTKEYNENSGRLLIPEKWLVEHSLPSKSISYNKTKKYIKDIYNGENKYYVNKNNKNKK